MSDDRDTVTHIGKSRGGGGGGGLRPTVVKGKSNLNQAFRDNNVTSEKKSGPANSVSFCVIYTNPTEDGLVIEVC
jgi:Multiprotein bridging factor 1